MPRYELGDELRMLSITIVCEHVCGKLITLYGDTWDEVRGECETCDAEIDLDLTVVDAPEDSAP